MISFDTFLQDLSSLELSGTVYGNSGYGSIPEEHVPKVVSAVNASLRFLYGRYHLKEDVLFLETIEGQSLYPLTKLYSAQNVSSPIPVDRRYIKDSPEKPFLGDLVKVLEVWDSNRKRYSINDAGCCDGISTPTPDTIQLENHTDPVELAVTYQALHPEVGTSTLHLDIPHILQDLLRLRVAYQILTSMGGTENTTKAQEYLALFNMSLVEYEKADSFGLTVHNTTNKFDARGFC